MEGSFQTYKVNIRDEVTTETDDKAIAPDAIQGFKLKFKGRKMPAAIGIPMKLYIRAKMKFDLILRTVFLDRSMAATTSIKLFWKMKETVRLKSTNCCTSILYKTVHLCAFFKKYLFSHLTIEYNNIRTTFRSYKQIS